MGRMNDVEKKKTLFQVLSRLKEIYFKFQLVLEWTKVSNEHLAIKTIKSNAKTAKDNLNRLIGGIYQSSNNIQMRKHSEPNFKALKDLLTVRDRVPSYLAPSIEALAPAKNEALSEEEREFWLSTLESLLRTEISNNIVNIPKKDYKLISISNRRYNYGLLRLFFVGEGKAKILFLNLFEFELTLVPSGDNIHSAWFILGVQVDSMKEIFKNSLTGIFQYKYNNNNDNSKNGGTYFKSLISDCSKYIELFYYEKIFSQFSFLSNFYGKSICSFQKSPNGDWFKFKPWFMTEDTVVSNDKIFKVDGLAESFMIPKLSFNEREGKNIFEDLFGLVYRKRLEEFFKIEEDKGIINKFSMKNKFTFDIELFEGFKLILNFNPFTKKFKFDFIETLNFCNFDENLENSLINFDFELFEEIIFEIKREIFFKIIKATKIYEFSIVSCSEVSSEAGLCLQLKKEPSLAFSLNLNTFLAIKFWKINLNYQNTFMDMKFKEILPSITVIDETRRYKVPKNKRELDEFLRKQEGILLKISVKFSFKNLIKSIGIEGEEQEEDNNFRILSLGLPNCIKNIFLYEDENLVKVKLELEGLKRGTLEIHKEENILNHITGVIRLFSIFEHFNLLKEDGNLMEIESFEPLRLKHERITFYLNEFGKVEALSENERIFELEDFIESDDFNIYDFVDKLINLELNNSALKDREGSPDIMWLSDSFM
jgi:hypothetical protein